MQIFLCILAGLDRILKTGIAAQVVALSLKADGSPPPPLDAHQSTPGTPLVLFFRTVLAASISTQVPST